MGIQVPFDQPEKWDATAKDFFAKLQEFEPQKRPEAAELLKHPYIKTAVSQVCCVFVSELFVSF